MAYQKQTWRDYDDNKTELQNLNNGALVTPERMNHIETGIANSVDQSTFEQNKVSVEQQLQHKVNQSDMDSWVATILDGGPSIFYETLSALEADYPNGAAGVALVRETDPARIYAWNGTQWQDFGAYQGIEIKNHSVTTLKLAPKNVLPKTTSFAVGGGGKNLFDGLFTNLFPSGNAPNEVNAGTSHRSAIVEFPSAGTFTFSKSSDSDRFRIAFFSEYPKVGSVPTRYFSTDAGAYRTYTLEANERYALVFLSSSSQGTPPTEFQVEYGDRPTEYVAPNEKIVIDLDKKSLTEIMDKSAKNLFDGEYRIGSLEGNFPYALTDRPAKYALIEVPPNTSCAISKSTDTNRFRVGTFTDIPQVGDVPVTYYRDDASGAMTITTDNTVRYLVVVVTSVDDSREPEWLQVELGENATEYEPPYSIKKSLLPYAQPSTGPIGQTHFVITGNLAAEYTVFTEAPVMDSTLDLDVVYGHFDSLVNEYPDYVFRSLMIEESTGLPVYRYDFIPPATGSIVEDVPKILHVNGIHGSEKQSLGSGMRFYADLCRHWPENELLEALRWNIHFVVIPALNAWGVENNQRLNANGVNLNRNFPFRWSSSSESGANPLSEPESQALMTLLETENFIFAIDHHRFNPYAQDGYTMWTGTLNRTTNKYLSGWSRMMNGLFKKMHPDLAVGNEARVHVLGDYAPTRHGWLSFCFSELAIPGTILEISLDSELNDFHTNAMGKLFGYAARELHNDKNKWL